MKFFITLGLVAATVASAAFQIVILIVSGLIGGPISVGIVSLYIAIANFVCIFLLSDLKTLSVINLSNDRSLHNLSNMRVVALLFLSLIAICAAVLINDFLVISVILTRAFMQSSDIHTSVWQVKKKPTILMTYVAVRYGGSSIIMFALAHLTNDINFTFFASSIFVIVIFLFEGWHVSKSYPELQVHMRLRDISAHWRDDLSRKYYSLALAGGINTLPHVVLRYLVSAFSGAAVLGSFAIQYQVSMLAVPVITAVSQQMIARPSFSREIFIRDMALIAAASLAICMFWSLVFLTPAALLLEWVFKDWLPLDPYSTILVLIACFCLCVSVYAGFLAASVGPNLSQAQSNMAFLIIMGVGGVAGGWAFGHLGIFAAFAVSAAVKLFILAHSVEKSLSGTRS